MSSKVSLKSADSIASIYDEYVFERSWTGPEKIFDLLKPFIAKDQKMLDIGIGTGLSSIKFHNEGVKIFGIDGSREMLKQCEKKGFAEELKLCDIVVEELPFKNQKFDFVISYAVFHISGYIETIFKQVGDYLEAGGIFLFSVADEPSQVKEFYKPSQVKGVWEYLNPATGLYSYMHEKNYIRELIAGNNMELHSRSSFLAFRDRKENREVYFSVYLCSKKARTGRLIFLVLTLLPVIKNFFNFNVY